MSHRGLIIFDIDGTLFQTLLVTVPAVQETCVAWGLPEPASEKICSFIGRPVEQYEAWVASLANDGDGPRLVEACNAHELDLIASAGLLFPGVRDTLEQLRRDGYALAISSNGPDAYVDRFLDAHAMRPHFDVIRTRGTRYSGKEEMVREIMQIISARPVVVVGDRADDVESAHANGALAVGVTYGFGTRKELAGADALVDSAEEIRAAVQWLVEETSPGPPRADHFKGGTESRSRRAENICRPPSKGSG